MNNIEFNKRFARDFGLSINVYDEPYFSERIELYGYMKEYIEFMQLMHDKYNDNFELFYSEYNQIKDSIIEYIKETETYKVFNADDMNKYAVKSQYRNGDAYKDNYVGKYVVSVDISKANYSTLVHYAQMNGTTGFENITWEMFMSKFTDLDYIKKSKYIRQVIFGNCNSKRIATYTKYITINRILNSLLLDESISENHVLGISTDEILIGPYDENPIKKCKALIQDVVELSKIVVPLSVEIYRVGKVLGTQAYIKDFVYKDGKYDLSPEIKCAAPEDYVIIARNLKNQEVNENDSVFFYNGQLAKFLKPKDIKIEYSL